MRGTVVLPHGTGRDGSFGVCQRRQIANETAGADFVGGEELAAKIQEENWLDFDVAVATPDMMGVVGRIGRIWDRRA